MKNYILGVLGSGFLVGAAFAHSHTQANESAEVLYNLVRFSEWQDERSAPSISKFDICVCGDDDRVTAISELRGKTNSRRPVNVHILKSRDEIETVCRVLYLSSRNYSSLNLGCGDKLTF